MRLRRKFYFWGMRVVTGSAGLVYKVYVGAVFLATLLLFYPILLIVLSRREWRRWSFPVNVCWSYLARALMLVWVHKTKKAAVPAGPCMIVANHTSYFDIFQLYSVMPHHRFLFMGKSEILSYPLIKTFFKRLNIPVYRNDKLKAAKAFIQAKQAIAEGWSVVIFPEGGIPDECLPEMVPFKDGAFKLAKSCSVPVIPITFLDNWHLFSDPGTLLGPAHPGVSRVYVHEAVPAAEVARMTEKELSDRVFDTIAEPLIRRGWMKSKK